MTFFLERFDKKLGANAAGHDKFFVGGALTVADLKVPVPSQKNAKSNCAAPADPPDAALDQLRHS